MTARVWGLHTAQRMGKGSFPDCSKCRRPGEEGKGKRERWGCEALARRDVFTTGCSRCFGAADPANPCPDCKDGVITRRRCPTALLEQVEPRERAELGRAFQAYLVWDAHHALPVAGGWLDQTAAFHQVCSLVDHERGRYNQIYDEHQEQERMKRDSAQRARQASGGNPGRR